MEDFPDQQSRKPDDPFSGRSAHCLRKTAKNEAVLRHIIIDDLLKHAVDVEH